MSDNPKAPHQKRVHDACLAYLKALDHAFKAPDPSNGPAFEEWKKAQRELHLAAKNYGMKTLELKVEEKAA